MTLRRRKYRLFAARVVGGARVCPWVRAGRSQRRDGAQGREIANGERPCEPANRFELAVGVRGSRAPARLPSHERTHVGAQQCNNVSAAFIFPGVTIRQSRQCAQRRSRDDETLATPVIIDDSRDPLFMLGNAICESWLLLTFESHTAFVMKLPCNLIIGVPSCKAIY